MVAFMVTDCRASASETTVVKLRNDLDTSAVLVACEDFHCHEAGGTVTNHLALGDSLPVNVSIEGVPTYYRVVTSAIRNSKCLTLEVNGSSPTNDVVALSLAVDCRRSSRLSYPAEVLTTPESVSLMGTVISWALYLLFTAVGLASIAAIIWFSHRYLRARGVGDTTLSFSMLAITIAAFMGVWLVADLYWLGRGIIRLVRRTGVDPV
jgi:hypothetical protein